MNIGALFVLVAVLMSVPIAVVAGIPDIDPEKIKPEKIKVLKVEDRFLGAETWYVKPKALRGTGFLTTLYLNPVYFKKENGTDGFYLWIKYQGYGWVFLNGQVVLLLSDGSRISLTGPDSSNARTIETCSSVGCIDSEVIRIPITQGELEKISTSIRIEVRVYGQKSFVEGNFKPEHVAAIKAIIKTAADNQKVSEHTPGK